MQREEEGWRGNEGETVLSSVLPVQKIFHSYKCHKTKMCKDLFWQVCSSPKTHLCRCAGVIFWLHQTTQQVQLYNSKVRAIFHPPLPVSCSKKKNRKHISRRTMMLKIHTSISRQAALSRVIWSAMVKLVKPGNRFANSTILIMHFVASSLNLSQSPRSSRTRWSALEFWKDRQTEGTINQQRSFSNQFLREGNNNHVFLPEVLSINIPGIFCSLLLGWCWF